jgi:hypothetical protein
MIDGLATGVEIGYDVLPFVCRARNSGIDVLVKLISHDATGCTTGWMEHEHVHDTTSWTTGCMNVYTIQLDRLYSGLISIMHPTAFS